MLITVKDIQSEPEFLLKIAQNLESPYQAILIRAKAFAIVSFFSRVAIEQSYYQESAEVLDMWGKWYLPQFEMIIDKL